MNNIKSILKPTSQRLAAASLIIFAFGQCSHEDILPHPQATDATPTLPVVTPQESPATFSMTITGTYTEVTTLADCSQCGYSVPAGTTVIDGKQLGIRPGTVVCLQAALKYTNIEFINMDGTAERPVVIARCGVTEDAAPTEDADSEEGE